MSGRKTACPFLTVARFVNGCSQKAECMKWDCEMYTKVYTTELKEFEGCAFELKVHMNSEGLYVV
jgi:hypothetical protein